MKKQLLFIGLFITTLSVVAQIPQNGLVAHFPFSGNANDQSGNNLNGTVSGASLTADRFGIVGTAYSFSAGNYIEVAHNSLLNLNQGSYSFWMKDNTTPNSNGCAIIYKSNGNGIFIPQYGDGVCGVMDYASGNQSGMTRGIQNIYDGNWHHVVFTFKSNAKRYIYVDAILRDSATVNTFNHTSTTALRIGRAQDSWWDNYTGLLDDIRIYNRQITANEVAALYNESICKQTVTVTDTLVITNPIITNFNPITYSTSIKMYPNPVKSDLIIDFGSFTQWSGFTVKIYNSLSQVVYQKAINSQQDQVSFSTWTGNGIYFVHIIDPTNNTIDVRKIVLQ